MYNPDTKSWDCVGEFPHGYYLEKSVRVNENKILFVGGATSTHNYPCRDYMRTTCMMLTPEPHHLTLIDNHY